MADHIDNDDVVFAVLKTIVGTFGFIGNVLVCVTICLTKTLHSIANLTILNLAVADALASLCGVQESWIISNYDSHLSPNSTDCTAEFLTWRNMRWTYIFFVNSFYAHSVLGLTLATWERFVGINRPLHYASFFSQRKIILLLVIVWAVPVLVELPRSVSKALWYPANICDGTDSEYIAFSAASALLFALPAGAMMWMYVRILGSLKRGARNFQGQGLNGQDLELLHAHKKVTGILIIVALSFFLLVLPGKIYLVVDTVTTLMLPDEDLLMKLFLLLTAVNSAINPIFYGFKYQQMRRAFGKLVRRCMGTPNRVGQELQLQTVHWQTTGADESCAGRLS